MDAVKKIAGDANVPQSMLPKLLYVADVPVENTFHGSAVMYRLLEHYPPERLRIVETRLKSEGERRLPNVDYRFIRLAAQRLLTTRFHRIASSVLQLTGGLPVRSIIRACEEFAPEAVLTVAHGYAWQAAARFADIKNVPLHTINHDNWPDTFSAPDFIKKMLIGRFRSVYQQAATRLCVSPRMAAQYASEFGAPATVLYPARAASLKTYDTPSPRVADPGCPFTIGYAGTVHGYGHVAALRSIAVALAAFGGELHIFGPTTAAQLQASGLDAPNVRVRGVIDSDDLLETWRRDVDVLAIAVPFTPADLRRMELNFPSKLTDYTAAGLPILIYGPPTCSAVTWARENPDVAAVVDSERPGNLADVIGRLMSDTEWRGRITATAMMVGQRQFDSAVADRIFRAALAGGRDNSFAPAGSHN